MPWKQRVRSVETTESDAAQWFLCSGMSNTPARQGESLRWFSGAIAATLFIGLLLLLYAVLWKCMVSPPQRYWSGRWLLRPRWLMSYDWLKPSFPPVRRGRRGRGFIPGAPCDDRLFFAAAPVGFWTCQSAEVQNLCCCGDKVSKVTLLWCKTSLKRIQRLQSRSPESRRQHSASTTTSALMWTHICQVSLCCFPDFFF